MPGYGQCFRSELYRSERSETHVAHVAATVRSYPPLLAPALDYILLPRHSTSQTRISLQAVSRKNYRDAETSGPGPGRCPVATVDVSVYGSRR